MLAGPVPGPVRHVQLDRDDRCGFPSHGGNRGDLPAQSSATAVPAMGLRRGGSRRSPRSRARCRRSGPGPRTHLAVFQKYRCGTSSRAGPRRQVHRGGPTGYTRAPRVVLRRVRPTADSYGPAQDPTARLPSRDAQPDGEGRRAGQREFCWLSLKAAQHVPLLAPRLAPHSWLKRSLTTALRVVRNTCSSSS
jgi:hypothetical protein